VPGHGPSGLILGDPDQPAVCSDLIAGLDRDDEFVGELVVRIVVAGELVVDVDREGVGEDDFGIVGCGVHEAQPDLGIAAGMGAGRRKDRDSDRGGGLQPEPDDKVVSFEPEDATDANVPARSNGPAVDLDPRLGPAPVPDTPGTNLE